MSDNLSSLAQSANNAITDPAPYIDHPPVTDIQLLRGLLNAESGEWQTSAVVRELTGEDEEALAAFDSKEGVTYGEYLAHLLQRAVVSIGSQEVNKNKDIIDNLIIGDRDVLFLAIVRATYGKTREVQLSCGSCGGSNDVSIDLDEDFKMEKVEDDLSQPILVKLKDGNTLSFNLPTTGDSRYASKKGKTVAEQNTFIIARCLQSDEGTPSSRESWSKKLNVADRKKILKKITSVQPGPRMGEVETQCAHCDENLTVVLDWVSLLFS
jgi:hypothetical protein